MGSRTCFGECPLRVSTVKYGHRYDPTHPRPYEARRIGLRCTEVDPGFFGQHAKVDSPTWGGETVAKRRRSAEFKARVALETLDGDRTLAELDDTPLYTVLLPLTVNIDCTMEHARSRINVDVSVKVLAVVVDGIALVVSKRSVLDALHLARISLALSRSRRDRIGFSANRSFQSLGVSCSTSFAGCVSIRCSTSTRYA